MPNALICSILGWTTYIEIMHFESPSDLEMEKLLGNGQRLKWKIEGLLGNGIRHKWKMEDLSEMEERAKQDGRPALKWKKTADEAHQQKWSTVLLGTDGAKLDLK